MDQIEIKATFRARLAELIETAKEEQLLRTEAAVLAHPDRAAELRQQYAELCAKLDVQLAEFDACPLDRDESYAARRAQLVLENEECKRVCWELLVKEAQQDPKLDIVAEHNRICAELDQMQARADQANARIYQLFAETKETMINVIIALHQGDTQEADRLIAEYRAKYQI